MPSIEGFARPADGSGVLFYHPTQPGDPRNPPLIFRFGTRFGWTGDRTAPFAWRLIEPVGELRFPVLDLVADRLTTIIPPSAYAGTKGPEPSVATPMVRVLRPQAARNVPQEEGEFDVDQVLGNHNLIRGATERTKPLGARNDPVRHRFVVRHFPLSNQGKMQGQPACLVTNLAWHYQLQLRVTDIWRPAAYWAAVDDLPSTVRSATARIFTAIDRNVELRNIKYSEIEGALRVELHLRATGNERDVIPELADGVPEMGWPKRYEWMLRKVELIEEERPEGYWQRRFVERAEDLVGLVPGWGDLYDIGSIAWISATGKMPWTGDRVPRAMGAVYGAAAIGPASVSALRRIGRARELPAELLKLADEGVAESLKRAADPEVVLRLYALDQVAVRELSSSLIEVGASRKGSVDFAERLRAAIATHADVSTPTKRFVALQRYSRIGSLMSGPDLLLEPLNSSYRAYLARHGLTEAEVPPLEWCLRRRSGPNLATLATLGPNWRGLLRVVAGTGADAVRQETVEAAVRALRAGHGGGPYIDLCKLTKNMHPVMERDHITESRFFYNNPYFSEGMNMVENGYALLVPRNAEMLGRIRRVDPRIPIPYTHADKDPLMRRLPDGGEHEYPLQAVWDCHIDTYNQLGLRVTPMGESLGALIHHDLAVNLEQLAGDMRQQAAIFRNAGQSKLAGIIERSAKFEKRIDPKHRAFRARRFDDPEWWRKFDS